jgi:phage replication O-like protein O
MADVQLEHGHVRIANRLVEAILDAEFTGAQVRILLALARLTYGWRKRTASVSVVELANLAGLSGTGGFRRAFHDLIRNGVILEMKEGRTLTYAIQKDFVAWGRFGGNEGRLALRWDTRPKSDDALLKHMESTGELTLQGHVAPEPPSTDDPTGSPSVTPQGHSTSPHRVNTTGAKSLFDETVEGGKDKKDKKDKEQQQQPAAVSDATYDKGDEIRAYAITPVAKGGSADFDNLQTLCQPCNAGKAARAPHPHDMGE